MYLGKIQKAILKHMFKDREEGNKSSNRWRINLFVSRNTIYSSVKSLIDKAIIFTDCVCMTDLFFTEFGYKITKEIIKEG
jgi:hypothetical protein